MATFIPVSFDDLTTEALDHLYREVKRPLRLEVGTSGLASETSTSLTLSDPDAVSVTDLLEAPDGELMLVTEKSDDAVPVFRVVRGYANTSASQGWLTGSALLKNPRWGRADTATRVRRAVETVFNRYLPFVQSITVSRDSDLRMAPLPSDTIRVLAVRYLEPTTGRMVDVGGWRLEDRLPSTMVSSGKALSVPSFVGVADSLIVDVQSPYDTSGPDVLLPVGSADLPVLWAAAYSVARREVGRADLSAVEEFTDEESYRQGVSQRLIRELWLEFYRRLDESRAIYDVPRHRPYRRMVTL